MNKKNFNLSPENIFKQVEDATDVKWLKQMLGFIDLDISRIENDPMGHKTMLAEAEGMTLNEYNEKQRNFFQEWKEKIEKRIDVLEKSNNGKKKV